jgi:hypothetical protein
MAQVRTKISVAGFNDAEIAEGLQTLLAEFRERPWLNNPNAEWDSGRKLLLVIIETEGDDPRLEAEGVLDEVWDCVIACFNFPPERVSFDISEAMLIL